MKTFASELGRVMHRPSWAHVPSFAIKLAMGQMGEEMLLASQAVLPKRLEEEGFTFQFPEIRPALTSIFNA
jgi:NAD dependent epimerase/dehydratase family enzyme